MKEVKRTFGNALRSFLLDRDETDWDLLLPQLTRPIRGTPHSFTYETPNFIMFEREFRMPDSLTSGPSLEKQSRENYAGELENRLAVAYEFTRNKQAEVRANDLRHSLLF